MTDAKGTDIGLYGLAVMGQNFALNIATKGFTISVCNRSESKVDDCMEQAKKQNVEGVHPFKNMGDFVASIKKPRNIIILVKAGKPVEAVIGGLLEHLEPGDQIIDGGNEWYENTVRRIEMCKEKNILYMGMGISGGEEGARFGPSLMPGGSKEGYERVSHILRKAACTTDDGTICCNFVGEGGAGNYVKMVHNGIEYGDMQLIAEAYDMLQKVCSYTPEQIAGVFDKWNKGDLQSYLIEITADIFKKKDDRGKDENEFLVNKVLDKTGNKGTGKWTCKDGAEQGVPIPTINAALTARYISALKDERVAASSQLLPPRKTLAITEVKEFVDDLERALFAAKICSYAQGMSLIKTMGENKGWNLNLSAIASLWKGGCIIRAGFLDRITQAFTKNKDLKNLLMDKSFKDQINEAQNPWRKVMCVAIQCGIPTPAFSASLAYYDSYRRETLPANLTQAQRDYFGAHTYERNDDLGKDGVKYHSEWNKPNAKM